MGEPKEKFLSQWKTPIIYIMSQIETCVLSKNQQPWIGSNCPATCLHPDSNIDCKVDKGIITTMFPRTAYRKLKYCSILITFVFFQKTNHSNNQDKKEIENLRSNLSGKENQLRDQGARGT